MTVTREKKKYYFVVRNSRDEVVNLISKGKDQKEAECRLLSSFKKEKIEVLSVSEHYPINKDDLEVKKNKSSKLSPFYNVKPKDKYKRNRRFFG